MTVNDGSPTLRLRKHFMSLCAMQPANDATNATLSGQVSESKWAVWLSERSFAAGEIKRENRDIPIPDCNALTSLRLNRAE